MKINKLILFNFKSYYQEQVFDFKNGLNIVSGRIGTGKTSLYEAFQWILLDELTANSNIDADFIINKKYEYESLVSALPKIESSVWLEVEDKKVIYHIQKTNTYFLSKDKYELKEKTVSIRFEEPRSGNTKLLLNKEEVEVKLDDLFPEKLRKYLLFKGETLNELIDFSNPNTLEQAVKQISYLPLFTRMSRIIEDIINKTDKKYRNRLQANSRDQNKFDKLNSDLELKKHQLQRRKGEYIEAKSDIEKLKTREKEYIEKLKFIAGFPELKEKESSLQYERNRAFDQLEKLDSEGKNLFINKWILGKGQDLFDESDKELRKFLNWRHEQIAETKEQLDLGVPGDHLINKMIDEKKCLICGTTVKEKPEILDIIKTHLDENKKIKNILSDDIEDLNEKVTDIVKNVSFIKNSTRDVKMDLIKHIQKNKEIESNIARINDSQKTVKEKIDNLIEEKGYQILELNPTTITNAIHRIKEDIDNRSSKKDYYERQVRELESEIRALSSKLEDLAGLERIDMNKMPEKLALNHLEEIHAIIDKKVKLEKVDLIQKIQDEANRIQKSIVEQSKDNKLIILYVRINKEDYSISFVDKDGNPNPGHGAQVTLAKMSLISSVLKLSNEYKGEDYPFIVDAPASNFDDTITKPFIESVSQNFSQGLVILKDIHLEINSYKDEDFTKTLYIIEKISDTEEEASITNNYTQIKRIK